MHGVTDIADTYSYYIYMDINKLSRLQNSVKYEHKTSMYLHTYYATQDIHIIQCNSPHMISADNVCRLLAMPVSLHTLL